MAKSIGIEKVKLFDPKALKRVALKHIPVMQARIRRGLDYKRKVFERYSDQYKNIKTVILEGKSIDSSLSSTKKRERILIRFMTKIPLIVGVDMKNYGPFEPEDIATLPRENAEALIRQKAALEIRI